MAAQFRHQQRASFHGDRFAGNSDLGMLNAELGKRKVAAETKARIAKKEKYNARPQQSH
jgi:hypothetical protein